MNIEQATESKVWCPVKKNNTRNNLSSSHNYGKARMLCQYTWESKTEGSISVYLGCWTTQRSNSFNATRNYTLPYVQSKEMCHLFKILNHFMPLLLVGCYTAVEWRGKRQFYPLGSITSNLAISLLYHYTYICYVTYRHKSFCIRASFFLSSDFFPESSGLSCGLPL